MCGEPRPGVPRLESYAGVQIPGTYWVDMTFDGREWSPATPIGMPAHHASRLELTNLADFPALASHQAGRLRLSVEITAREVREVASRNQWRAEYYARIVEACAT